MRFKFSKSQKQVKFSNASTFLSVFADRLNTNLHPPFVGRSWGRPRSPLHVLGHPDEGEGGGGQDQGPPLPGDGGMGTGHGMAGGGVGFGVGSGIGGATTSKQQGQLVLVLALFWLVLALAFSECDTIPFNRF